MKKIFSEYLFNLEQTSSRQKNLDIGNLNHDRAGVAEVNQSLNCGRVNFVDINYTFVCLCK